MNNLTLSQILQRLKKTYVAIDLRFLLLETNGNWNSILTSIYLTSETQQNIALQQRSLIKNVEIKKNPRAEIVMINKPISAIQKIINDLKDEKFQVKNRSINTIGTKDIENLYATPILSSYFTGENVAYEFMPLTSGSPLSVLEKELRKDVFGFDNNKIYSLVNIPSNYYVSFLLRAPRYCEIDITDKEKIVITMHRNLVTRSNFFVESINSGKPPVHKSIKPLSNKVLNNTLEELLFSVKNVIDDEFKIYVDYQNLRIAEKQSVFHVPSVAEIHPLDEDLEVLNNQPTVDDNQKVQLNQELLSKLRIYFNEDKKKFFTRDAFNNEVYIHPNGRLELVVTTFSDNYFMYLRSEINLVWSLGSYVSTMILSRKLVEQLVKAILEKKYPKNIDLKNIDIYYKISEGRYHDFNILIRELENRKADFIAKEKDIDKFLSMVKPFVRNANSSTHSLTDTPSEDEIKEYDIGKMVELLNNILLSVP